VADRPVAADQVGDRGTGAPSAGLAVGASGAGRADEAPDGRSFEELVAELEAITDRLASGELGIEAAADLYEQAERIHALAAARLTAVQARMEHLGEARDST
jgi:exodeoxyribonuclease VII small subunit